MDRYVSLNNYNTFGLHVTASFLYTIHDATEIFDLIKESVFKNERRLILGGGSNVLFLDDFYNGLVIRIENKGKTLLRETDQNVYFRVAAGELWSDFVNEMVQIGYGGIENLSFIPGTVGAAPIQNIGAYGSELKDVFYQLTAIDLLTGEKVFFNKEECEFGYRTSVFKTRLRDRYLITHVDFKLNKQPSINSKYAVLNQFLYNKGIVNPTVEDISKAVTEIRKSKLPDPSILGNAGSFFKNPVIHNLLFQNLQQEFPDIVGHKESSDFTKISAAWLIEKTNWKGKRVGNAGFHDKQALVLVNYGNATGRELFNVAMQAKQAVIENFGIELDMEVNIA
jgi:UDP-N-acetylmuramate dehydrogenase